MRKLIAAVFFLLSHWLHGQPITIEIPESEILLGTHIDDTTFLVIVNHFNPPKSVIYKLNQQGDTIWIMQMNPGSASYGYDTQIPNYSEWPLTNDSGFIFIGGSFRASKIDNNGNLIWTKGIAPVYTPPLPLIKTLSTRDGGALISFLYTPTNIFYATLLKIDENGDSVSCKDFFVGNPYISWDLMEESDSTYLFSADGFVRLDSNFNQVDSFNAVGGRFIDMDGDSITIVGYNVISRMDKAITNQRLVWYPPSIKILDAKKSGLNNGD